MRVLTDELRFPEGPVVLGDGSVLVCEIRSGTIARVDADGEVERVATTGGGPNGAALGPDGRLYVCQNGGFSWTDEGGIAHATGTAEDYVTGSIQAVDLQTGAVETLYTECEGHNLKGPNDIVFDAHGGFYFSDLGKRRARDLDYGGLYYAKADGSEIRELAFPMISANGVGLSPAGDRVYVAETSTARLWTWEIEAPGRLRTIPGGFRTNGGTCLHTMLDNQLQDSLAVEESGNICVATLGSGGISVISPAGELLEFVDVPGDDPFVTNICFGGPDLRTAYITVSGTGRLLVTEWPRPGLRLNHQAQPAASA